jgi:hypothetical protein
MTLLVDNLDIADACSLNVVVVAVVVVHMMAWADGYNFGMAYLFQSNNSS